MTATLTRDTSTQAQILDHLQACDAQFVPPLSTRIALPDYARKIATQATRIEAWDGAVLTGLIALYCNAPDRGAAFASNVSVRPSHGGQGLGRHLMGQAIDHARALGFAQIMLEVAPDNTAARALYAGLGFVPAAQSNHLSLKLTP